jgi:dipeptidyl aminopeptidase/acylaminoacyl peptidase
MPDTHEDIRRRLFDAAWEAPAYAPAVEKTIGRARRRAAITIGGAALAVILGIVVAASSFPIDPEERTAIHPKGVDNREFLVDITSGKVTEISGLPILESAWYLDVSPDGRRIAFTSDTTGSREIHVADLDGTGLEQVTEGSHDVGEAHLSPSGEEVAYWALDGKGVRNIHVTDLATGRSRRITDESVDTWGLEWSPDGHSILYSVSIAAEPTGVEEGYFNVNATLNIMRSVDVRTRRIENVFGGAKTMAYDGTWTPDGILFVRGIGQVNGFPERVDLAVLEATGRARGVVPLAIDYWDERAWSPQLSPDGRTIAYVRVFEGTEHVFLADLETGRTWELRRGFLASWVDADTLLVQDAPE